MEGIHFLTHYMRLMFYTNLQMPLRAMHDTLQLMSFPQVFNRSASICASRLFLPLLLAMLASTNAQEPNKLLDQGNRRAVADFAADMQAIKDWVTQNTVSADGSEVSELSIRRGLIGRLESVRTSGLPSDLAKAYTAYTNAEKQHTQIYAEMPKSEAGAAWLETRRKDEKRRSAFDQALGKRMEAQDALIGLAVDYEISRQVDIFNAAQIFDRWVVVLSSHKDFAKARASALTISKSSKIPFSMNELIYDKQGLRLPDNHEDEVLAGTYILRRHNSSQVGKEVVENHISIENSADYGFEQGNLIVVGKIAESADKAQREVARFKPFAPDAYAAKAEIYMGCMH